MKKLDAKQKKIIDIVVTVLEICVVILAITVSAIVIANPKMSTAEVSGGSVKLLPVLTDSMAGDEKDSFKAGDLVVAGKPKDVLGLKEGEIITYRGSVNGQSALITHRIVEVRKSSDGAVQTYITHGDANPAGATETVNPNDVLAVYKFHLKGVGKAINWLQDPTHFLLVIVLPLILLFIYNIVMFVRMIMQYRTEKAVKAATANGSANLDEEEIKRKAIEEYIAKQNEQKDNSESDPQNVGESQDVSDTQDGSDV